MILALLLAAHAARCADKPAGPSRALLVNITWDGDKVDPLGLHLLFKQKGWD